MKTQREKIRVKQRRQRTLSRAIWGVLILVALIGAGFLLWRALRPSVGESIPIMADIEHVEDGTDPGIYNSDPPTSGPHYASDLEAGFYHEEDLDNFGDYPEGFLVHNLEHGYVIFWYNCSELDSAGCQDLKSQIQSVMDGFDSLKLIAFPRPTLDYPVAMTSWGKYQQFEQFDADLARRFVEGNRNRAPEPNAP